MCSCAPTGIFIMNIRFLLLLLVLFSGGSGARAAIRPAATLVLLGDTAASQGAVCLDGSAPGYYIRPGTGDGARKWIVHQEGGGICFTPELCFERSKTELGSSTDWPPTKELHGFLSGDPQVNPDFYNWNIVEVQYCDGGIYSSDMMHPFVINNTILYFRGWRVLKANIEALLLAGMNSATDIIFSGSSAGGVSTYLHADQIAAMVPSVAKFRAFSDAGFLVNVTSVNGQQLFRLGLQLADSFQNLSGSAMPECTAQFSGEEIYKCLTPAVAFSFTKAPLFILNSQYDTWQIENILQLGCVPPHCTEEEMVFVDQFREEWLSQAQSAINATSGAFIDSCFVHTQASSDQPWMTIEIDNHLMRDVFADWYYGRGGETNLVDCPYPCNPTCSAGNAATSGAVGSTLLCLMSAVVTVMSL